MVGEGIETRLAQFDRYAGRKKPIKIKLMNRAIILDYEDGTINILPIPEDTPESKECEYVESHPCYNSDSMSYMIVGETAEVFKVNEEESKRLGQVIYNQVGEI